MIIKKRKASDILYGIYLVSFYLFSYGKFLTIPLTIGNLIKDLFINKTISKASYKSYKYFFLILLLFIFSFLSALHQGNDLLHIIRNNFFTLIFILTGIQVASRYESNYTIFFEMTVKIVGVLAFIQVIIFSFAMINLPFHVFLDDVFLKKTGYSMILAGLGSDNHGFGLKLVTTLTSIYLFLIPIIVYLKKKHLRKYLLFITIAVLASASITQYGTLLLYFFIYLISLYFKNPLCLIKNIFSIKFAVIGGVFLYVIVQMGFNTILLEKIENVTHVSNNENELNSASLRATQVEILMAELSENPLIGKGLGYDSLKYHDVRKKMNGEREIKFFNYSMYENQYLDILMKFGLIAGTILLFLFIVLPMYSLYIAYSRSKNKLYLSILIGYLGLAIFASSNGNTFYAYTTMFVWGIVINIISSSPISNSTSS